MEKPANDKVWIYLGEREFERIMDHYGPEEGFYAVQDLITIFLTKAQFAEVKFSSNFVSQAMDVYAEKDMEGNWLELLWETQEQAIIEGPGPLL